METAELQYRALVSLWPQFGNAANFSLPQPLDYFSDLPALVMERVKGASLQQLFGKIVVMPSRRRSLVSTCERTGRWLSHLHVATSIVPGKLNVEEKLVHATANLAKLESMGFSSELCRQCADFLNRQADRVALAETKMALVHGDFTVDNVMVDGDRIVALDLTGRDHNAIEHDLATFLNSLRLLRMTMPTPRALLDRCGDAFSGRIFWRWRRAFAGIAFSSSNRPDQRGAGDCWTALESTVDASLGAAVFQS
jgi:tRNA A-37 threonylcarbamoyl transferase component Bud32